MDYNGLYWVIWGLGSKAESPTAVYTVQYDQGL